MSCWSGLIKGKKKTGGSVPVYLNVYDLTPMNDYGYWLGLGVFHSGVEGESRLLYFFLSQFRFLGLAYSIRIFLFGC